MRWAEICKKIQKEENRGATLAHGVPAVTWQESQAWGITAHRRAQWRQILSYCTTAHTITGNWNILLRQLHPVRLLLVWVIELQACRDAEFTLNHSHFLLSSSLHFLPLSLLLTRWLVLSTELFYLLREKLPESLNQLFEILWRGASKQNPLDFLWLLSLFYTWALLWLCHKSFLTLRDRGTYLAYQNLAYQ